MTFRSGVGGLCCAPQGGLSLVQIEKVEVLLSQWRGRAAVLLNAEWTSENVDSQYKAFVKSFESVYSFLPLAIQVSARMPSMSSALTGFHVDVHVDCITVGFLIVNSVHICHRAIHLLLKCCSLSSHPCA